LEPDYCAVGGASSSGRSLHIAILAHRKWAPDYGVD
jgi:hypothetical protein